MTFVSLRRLLSPAGVVFAVSALGFCVACQRPITTLPMAQAAADAGDAKPATTDKVKEAPGNAPMFGGGVGRNFANTVEKNIPDTWSIKKGKEKNVKWKVKLGGNAFGGPVIAGGRIFLGTNNDEPFDKNVTGDKGVLLCLNEADGAFLWQIVHNKLDDGNIDYSDQGVVSTPAVDGDRLYYVSNRCELVCADVAGDPKAPGKGKIVWSLDMIKELKVHPGGSQGSVSSSSPLVVGDLVYLLTSNGVDINTGKTAAPDAPSFLAVHKDTGKVAWSSNLPSADVMDGQWDNPAAAEINGVMEVIFPGGDGWLYGFEAKSGELLWKFNCNPKKSEYKPKQGKGTRSYLVATPVVVGDKVYVGVGQMEGEPGVGHLWCIDIAKKPTNKDKDLSAVNDNFDPKAAENKDSGLVWHFGGYLNPKPVNGDRDYPFGRTISTVAIHDGLVYAAELEGYLHCLDAQTGKELWQHDIGGGTWASPYYVDGKVFMGVDNSDLLVFEAGKEDKLLGKIEMGQSMKVPPLAANGVLYVNNGHMLYAIAAK